MNRVTSYILSGGPNISRKVMIRDINDLKSCSFSEERFKSLACRMDYIFLH